VNRRLAWAVSCTGARPRHEAGEAVRTHPSHQPARVPGYQPLGRGTQFVQAERFRARLRAALATDTTANLPGHPPGRSSASLPSSHGCRPPMDDPFISGRGSGAPDGGDWLLLHETSSPARGFFHLGKEQCQRPSCNGQPTAVALPRGPAPGRRLMLPGPPTPGRSSCARRPAAGWCSTAKAAAAGAGQA